MRVTVQATVEMTLEVPETFEYTSQDLSEDLRGGVIQTIEDIIPAEVVVWTITPVSPLEA